MPRKVFFFFIIRTKVLQYLHTYSRSHVLIDFLNVKLLPGLDFAHSYNGYVYHTKHDRFNVIPRGTLQVTGENILSLAKAFANAPEMADTEVGCTAVR